jgi:hypothetical protein
VSVLAPVVDREKHALRAAHSSSVAVHFLALRFVPWESPMLASRLRTGQALVQALCCFARRGCSSASVDWCSCSRASCTTHLFLIWYHNCPPHALAYQEMNIHQRNYPSPQRCFLHHRQMRRLMCCSLFVEVVVVVRYRVGEFSKTHDVVPAAA